MLFLIEYDRRNRRLLTFETFENDARLLAQKKRLELELSLNRCKIDHEVVILEAPNEDALRTTHQRYFEGFDEIIKSASMLFQTNGHEQ